MPYSIADFNREVKAALRQAREGNRASESAIKTNLGAIATALNTDRILYSRTRARQTSSALDQTNLALPRHYRRICAAINKGKDGRLAPEAMMGAIGATLSAYSYPPSIQIRPHAIMAGAMLIADPGEWHYRPAITYQWMAKAATGPDVAITDATASQYQITSGDVGHTIYCAVTATNVDGNVTENTNLVTVPEGGPPPR